MSLLQAYGESNTISKDRDYANEMASAVLKEHGSCWKSSENPRLLKATPLKGSVASVDTLKRNGLACEMTGPGKRLPNLCPQYRSVVNFFCRS